MVMVCQMGACQGWQRPPSLGAITKEPSKQQLLLITDLDPHEAVWPRGACPGDAASPLAAGPGGCVVCGAAAGQRARASSIRLLPFITTLVRAGFGQKNGFWSTRPSFQPSPSRDQVSGAK